jgi:cell division protein ZapA (FtsZ GTPase activity inhibitor)
LTLTPILRSLLAVSFDGARVPAKVVEVVLQGRTFTLKTEGDSAELAEAANLLNTRLEELAGASGLSPHATALLTGLDLATELMRERAVLTDVREKIRTKSRWMLDLLDHAGHTETETVQGDDPPDGRDEHTDPVRLT